MAKKEPQNDSYQRLKQELRAKSLGRLYFFHGEETFLLHHYLEQMRRQLLDELTESFNYHRFTGETFDLQTFADAVENLPMMAEHTLVQVDDIDPFKMNETDRAKMAEVLGDIPEYCTVVFTFENLQWKADGRFKKLKEATDRGLTVEFTRQSQRELVPWIARHFTAHGKRISGDLSLYLIEITGGTMTALNGEIEKICAYSGAEEIVKADIDAVTVPVLDAQAFQMTDMLSAGRYGEALLKLHQLLQMQQEPLAILGAVGSSIRRISVARTLREAGKTAQDLQRLCGLKSLYPAQKAMEAARRVSPKFCKTAAELILDTDYKMKTSFDDPQRLLEMVVLRLSQEAKNG